MHKDTVLAYGSIDDRNGEWTRPGNFVCNGPFNLKTWELNKKIVVEKRSTCDAGNTPKHFHPAAGTLVYVLDGLSQSKSSGKWKKYSKGEYWFEPSDWVHGGDDDTPNLGNQCTDLLVIRVVEEGKDHTVFVD